MSKNQDAADNSASSKAQAQQVKTANQEAGGGSGPGSVPSPSQKVGMFHPSSGPADPMKLPPDVPAVGIDRARALRKVWLTQTRQLPPQRPEPDFDELEEAFDDEAPFDPPVHLPNLLLLLLDIWDEEGLLQ